MIKISFDTNAFYNNWLARGEAFELIAEFIVKGKARAYVSEISIREHVRHYKEEAPTIAARAKASLSKVSKLLLDGNVPRLPPLSDPASFEPAFRNRLTKLGIGVVPIPEVTHAALVGRDLAQAKPFGLDGKGYRDALIWLGFVSTIDNETQQAIFVTNNSKDFCNTGKNDLHPDLLIDIHSRNPGCSAMIFVSPNELVEHVIKPKLRAMAEEEAKTQEILEKIQSDQYEYFALSEVVTAGIDTFEAQEAIGPFYADGVSLEEPIWVTILEAPEHIEATSLLRLSSGNFVCEGTAQASATVEGFLEKWEAVEHANRGTVYISDPDWNEYSSEVEMSEVPAIITYSFEFAPESSQISNFEVTKVKSLQEL